MSHLSEHVFGNRTPRYDKCLTIAERVAALNPVRNTQINNLRAKIEEMEAKIREMGRDKVTDEELLSYVAAVPKCKAMPDECAADLIAGKYSAAVSRRGLYYRSANRYQSFVGLNDIGRAALAILTNKVPISVVRRAAVHAVLAHNEDCDAGQSPNGSDRWDEFDGPIQSLENPETILDVARWIATNARLTPERTLLRALLQPVGAPPSPTSGTSETT